MVLIEKASILEALLEDDPSTLAPKEENTVTTTMPTSERTCNFIVIVLPSHPRLDLLIFTSLLRPGRLPCWSVNLG